MNIINIANEFGVHPNTIRNWIDPVAYRKNLDRALEYQKKRPYSQKSRAQKDRHNELQRKDYAEKPAVRASYAAFARKYRATPQGCISHKLRLCILGHAGRHTPTHSAFMVAVTGMDRAAFTAQFTGAGEFDHIIPLIAFDLTKPKHVVRAMHPSNIRLISETENQAKGGSVGPVDIESLPWIGTPVALAAAAALVKRAKRR